MEILFDRIGVHAPVGLFLMTLLLLRNMPNYLNFFIIGTVLTNILNIILKHTEALPLIQKTRV